MLAGAKEQKWDHTFDSNELNNDGAVLCQTFEKDAEGQSILSLDSRVEKPTTNSYDSTAKKVLPDGSIGLDSLSALDLFCDARKLINIREAPRVMKIQCNAGYKEVAQIGHLSGYGDVWFDKNAVANILSLGRVTKRFKVTFKSAGSEGFILHLPGGRKRCFKKTKRGLFASQFLIPKCRDEVALSNSTVVGNKAHFTKREFKQAERARRLQTTLVFPSDRHLEKITEVLQDCPVTPQDVSKSRLIFGPSIGAPKGKTTKRKSFPVSVIPIKIPRPIRDRLNNLHLHANVCFVHGIAFVMSISDKIKFCTSEAVGSRTNEILVGALKKIQVTYRSAGFCIDFLSLDG